MQITYHATVLLKHFNYTFAQHKHKNAPVTFLHQLTSAFFEANEDINEMNIQEGKLCSRKHHTA